MENNNEFLGFEGDFSIPLNESISRVESLTETSKNNTNFATKSEVDDKIQIAIKKFEDKADKISEKVEDKTKELNSFVFIGLIVTLVLMLTTYGTAIFQMMREEVRTNDKLNVELRKQQRLNDDVFTELNELKLQLLLRDQCLKNSKYWNYPNCFKN